MPLDGEGHLLDGEGHLLDDVPFPLLAQTQSSPSNPHWPLLKSQHFIEHGSCLYAVSAWSSLFALDLWTYPD